MRKDPLPAVKNVFVYGSYNGSTAIPGAYRARLTVGEEVHVVSIQLMADPNIKATAEAYEEQAALLSAIDQQIATIHHTVTDMQYSIATRLSPRSLGREFNLCITSQKRNSAQREAQKWERVLIQPDQKTFQDVINFNNKLNAELMHLKGYVDSADPAVTVGAKERFDDLKKQWEASENALKALIENEIDAFNKEYNALGIPSLMLPAAYSN